VASDSGALVAAVAAASRVKDIATTVGEVDCWRVDRACVPKTCVVVKLQSKFGGAWGVTLADARSSSSSSRRPRRVASAAPLKAS
jgi:hypothetical protein